MPPLPALHRLPDWPERLITFLEDRRGIPFQWGRNDCVTFAADGVQAITGFDALGPLRGSWTSEREASLRLLARGGITNAVRSVLGMEMDSPALAQRGDVVLVRTIGDGGLPHRFVALCDADRWAAPWRHGVQRGPISMAIRAWGVGHG